MGRIYVNENQLILPKMLEIYKPIEYDWRHTSITKNGIFSIHHIIKLCNGGENTLENCALLLKKSHRVLNMLESRDVCLYNAWNDLFSDINKSMQPPTDMHTKEMILLRAKTKETIYKK